MSSVPLSHWIVVAALLFFVGLAGVLIRRNALIVLMSIELMLSGANLAILAFARARGDSLGHAVVFIVMAVAAAEVSVGLALVIALFRHQKTVFLDRARQLKG
jgi:NADH-quinone oxidoreductase subunit K